MKFDLYIDAVGDSAARSRGVIILLMTATLVAALGMFNSLQTDYNWFGSRIRVLHDIYPWLVFPDETVKDSLLVKELNSGNSKQKRTNRFDFNNLKTILGKDTINVMTLKGIPIPQLYYKFPKKYIQDGTLCLSCLKNDLPDQKNFKVIANAQRINPATRAELDDLLVIYDRTRLENTSLVRMPIIGITFDVNWLNFVSSISFSIILFLLYYNLSRERKNLYLVFRIAEKKKIDKLDFYQMLSMRQVLNVPPSVDELLSDPKSEGLGAANTNESNQPDSKRGINKSWRSRLAKFPIFAPALIWGLILVHDLSTLDIGESINGFLTYLGLVASIIFGSFMLFFVHLCSQQWNQINDIWKAEAEEVRASIVIKSNKNNVTPASTPEPQTPSADARP